jgi:pectate lyase
MPDAWEKANNLDPNNANDRNNVAPDGYTMLERYLNSITAK